MYDDDDDDHDDDDHDWQLCPCGRCESTRANRGVPDPGDVTQYADGDGIVRRI